MPRKTKRAKQLDAARIKAFEVIRQSRLLNLTKRAGSRALLKRDNLATVYALPAPPVTQHVNTTRATEYFSNSSCPTVSAKPAESFIPNHIISAGVSNENGSFTFLAATDFPVTSPITGLRQPNLHQQASKTLYCLLCSKETTQNITSLNNCTDKEADFFVMFLLKKMLGTPNENLAAYLSMLGHPRDWVNFCATCSPMVTGAFTLQKQISELEMKLRTFQDKMKATIMSSYVENQNKFQSVGAIIPASVPKSSPVVVTEETRDHVVRYMERIKKGARQISLETSLVNHAKLEETASLTVLSETAKNSVDVGSKCDDDDFSELPNNTSTMSSPIHDLVQPEPSFTLSRNATTNKKRKQTISVTVRRHNMANRQMLSSDPKCKEIEDPGMQKGTAAKMPKRQRLIKLPKFKQANPDEEVVYCCTMCPNLKSMQLRSFVKHLLYHFDRPYKCRDCNAYFTGDDTELTKHSTENQGGGHVCCRETLIKVNLETEKIWDCGYCSEAFKFESERELHEASAHPEKASIPLPYICIRCPKKFRDYPEWQFHRALQHPDLAKLGCFYCDEFFKFEVKGGDDVVDLIARNKHIKKYHGRYYTNADPLDCRTCGANFQSMDDLKCHARAAHGNNSEKLVWCPVCFKSWQCRKTMQYHIQYVHGQKSRERLICDLCAYETVTPSVLAEHRFLVHGLEPENKTAKSKVYSCTNEGCSFKCLLKGTFDTHMMKIHNAERRIKCRICGKGFLSSQHRSDHERTHDASTKPFQCEICGNSFAVKNYLYIHMRLSHQNRPFASTNRKRKVKSTKHPGQNAVENSTNCHPTANSSSQLGADPSSLHASGETTKESDV